MTDENATETGEPRSKRRTATASPSVLLAVDFPITVVETQGKACLVQWIEAGVTRRCILPAEKVEGNTASAELLAQGIPYGLPWARLLNVHLTPERLEEALHAAGLWTSADVQHNPMAAIGALQAAYGIDLGYLLTAASDFSEKKEA